MLLLYCDYLETIVVMGTIQNICNSKSNSHKHFTYQSHFKKQKN